MRRLAQPVAPSKRGCGAVICLIGVRSMVLNGVSIGQQSVLMR